MLSPTRGGKVWRPFLFALVPHGVRGARRAVSLRIDPRLPVCVCACPGNVFHALSGRRRPPDIMAHSLWRHTDIKPGGSIIQRSPWRLSVVGFMKSLLSS